MEAVLNVQTPETSHLPGQYQLILHIRADVAV